MRARSLVILLALGAGSPGCGGEKAEESPFARAPSATGLVGSQAVDCDAADTSSLSTFVVEPFQRDLAIDTVVSLTRHLDAEPALICLELRSSTHGPLPVIGYAAAHRPDAERIFPLLLARGAKADDAVAVAAHLGKSRVLGWLLDHGADPNSGGALTHATAGGHVRVVQALLEAGADPDLVAEPSDWSGRQGRAPIHFAATQPSQTMLESLIEAGADVEAMDDDRRTALALAAQAGRGQAVRLLVEAGASPHRLFEADAEALRRVARRAGLADVVAELE